MTIPYLNESKIFKLNPIKSPIKGVAYIILSIVIGIMAYDHFQSENDWLMTLVNLLWLGLSIHFLIKGIFLTINQRKQVIVLKQEYLYFIPIVSKEDEDLKDFEYEELAVESLNLKKATVFFQQNILNKNNEAQTQIEQLILRIDQTDHVFSRLEFMNQQDWLDFKLLLERKISYALWSQSPLFLEELKQESSKTKSYISSPKTLHFQLSVLFVIVFTLLTRHGLSKLEDADLEHLSHLNIIDNHVILYQLGALFTPMIDFSNQFLQAQLSLFSANLLNISLLQLIFHLYLFAKLLPILEYQIGKFKALIVLILSGYVGYLSSALFLTTNALSFGPGPMWAGVLGALYFQKSFEFQKHTQLPQTIQRDLQQYLKNIGILLFVLSLQLDAIPFLPFDVIKYIAGFFTGIIVYISLRSLTHQGLIKAISITLACLPILAFLFFSIQLERQATSDQPQSNRFIEERFTQDYQNQIELQLITQECLKRQCPINTLTTILPQIKALYAYHPDDQELLASISQLYATYAQSIVQAESTQIQLQWQYAQDYAWRSLALNYKEEVVVNTKRKNALNYEYLSASAESELLSYLLDIQKQKQIPQAPKLNAHCQILKPHLSFKLDQQLDTLIVTLSPFSKDEQSQLQQAFFSTAPTLQFHLGLVLETPNGKLTDIIDIDWFHLDQEQSIRFPLKPKAYLSMDEIKTKLELCQLSFANEKAFKSNTRARQYPVK